MQITLPESGRNLLTSAECAVLSLLAHAAVIWLAAVATEGGRQLPDDEREARVFFLLPPDRVEVRANQTEIFRWGRPGSDFEDGRHLARLSEGLALREHTTGARESEGSSGARGELPFGPVPKLRADTVFSMLEVDQIVERYEFSAAPAYPPDLIALGTEGLVQATYVVDTTGRVDTTTISVLYSDDPRFTESVRTALAQTRFRPARRAGKVVRQLVMQQFRFKIARSPLLSDRYSAPS